MVDVSKHLETGFPSPTIWKEIVTLLFAMSSRLSKPTAAVWPFLNMLFGIISLVCLTVRKGVTGAPEEPDKALFDPTVALTLQRCDDEENEDLMFTFRGFWAASPLDTILILYSLFAQEEEVLHPRAPNSQIANPIPQFTQVPTSSGVVHRKPPLLAF